MLDGVLTDEERKSISTLYWGSKGEAVFRPMLQSCPSWAHLRHVTLWAEDEHHNSYRTIPGPLQRCQTTRIQSVLHRLPFRGSAFLRHTLAELPAGLPEDYVFVHAHTPFNPSGQRSHRDIGPGEWQVITDRLDRYQVHGLVVDVEATDPIPTHPRLIDYRGKTTLAEAVEVLKRAQGYLGIDSCFSILAAELFPASLLMIRSRNPFLVANRDIFYPPHRSFPFLVPKLGARPYDPSCPVRPPHRVPIVVERACLIGSRSHEVGDLVEVSPEVATRLVADGQASYPEDWDVIA